MDHKKYQSVVDKAKKRWESLVVEKPEMKWCTDCEEINLWTYWQGRGVKEVDILVVGQDWGRPESDDASLANSKMDQIMENIRAMNAGNTNIRYFEDFSTNPDPTDRHLADLFGELRDGTHQLYPDIIHEKYDNLFFTNFCLGYRTGKQTGGMTKRVMMEDSDLFKELVTALQPKIIICLGLLTYQCVVETLFQKRPIQANQEFLAQLNANGAYENGIFNGTAINVYGMVHCGAAGVNINRKRGYTGTLSGLELMKRDWNRMNEEIKRRK